jgi:dipeptidyl aminopeptidase/acylaminoacyl peptidase
VSSAVRRGLPAVLLGATVMLVAAGARGALSVGRPEVGFLAVHGASRIDVLAVGRDGTGLRTLTSLPKPRAWPFGGLTLSPGRDLVAVGSGTGIVVVPVAGGKGKQLTTAADRPSSWSPDGRWILFNRDFSGGRDDRFIVAPDGTRLRELTNKSNAKFLAGTPAWAPDSKSIVATPYEAVMRLDLTGRRRSLRAEPLDYKDLAFSPDGHFVAMSAIYLPRGIRGIAIARANFTHFRWLAYPTGGFGDGAPAWSPDGKAIAFAAQSGQIDVNGNVRDLRQKIVIAGINGKIWTTLSPSATYLDNAPAWSPDGKSIAFERQRAQPPGNFRNTTLWAGDPHTGRVKRLYAGPVWVGTPVWLR